MVRKMVASAEGLITKLLHSTTRVGASELSISSNPTPAWCRRSTGVQESEDLS